MRYAFKAVAKAVGEVVCGIYLPCISRSVMMPCILLLFIIINIFRLVFGPLFFLRLRFFDLYFVLRFLLRNPVCEQVPHLWIAILEVLLHTQGGLIGPIFSIPHCSEFD